MSNEINKNPVSGTHTQVPVVGASPDEIWFTLRNIDTEAYVEQKGTGSFQAKFIPWATAYALAKNKYPELEVHFTKFHQADGTELDCCYYKDDSASVECIISIGEYSVIQSLAVMDYKFQSVTNPSSRLIQDAKSRALCKALGLLGLSLDLWMSLDPLSEKLKSTEAVALSLQTIASPVSATHIATAGVPSNGGANNG